MPLPRPQSRRSRAADVPRLREPRIVPTLPPELPPTGLLKRDGLPDLKVDVLEAMRWFAPFSLSAVECVQKDGTRWFPFKGSPLVGIQA